MKEKIVVVGIGYTKIRERTPEVSFREMIFEAAQNAYGDAGLTPKDIDTFTAISEDYSEGTAIFDEYVPDQLGAVQRPVHTITGDGITALASVFLQLSTGVFDTALIEAHSKASNIVYPEHIDALALDPNFVRPLALNPQFVAGLEMQSFLNRTGIEEYQCALIVEKNTKNASKNERTAFSMEYNRNEVLSSQYISKPLKELDIARRADGAVVLILTRESVARKLNAKLIYIKGIGWAQDTPNIEEREVGKADYASIASRMAYKMAGITKPQEEIDFAELDDTYSYKELQHIEALGLVPQGKSGSILEEGYFNIDGKLPVNPSGGSLGMGYTYDMSGLRSVMEVVLQLRQEAGENQIRYPRIGLAQSWRGIPTASGGVVILSAE